MFNIAYKTNFRVIFEHIRWSSNKKCLIIKDRFMKMGLVFMLIISCDESQNHITVKKKNTMHECFKFYLFR